MRQFKETEKSQCFNLDSVLTLTTFQFHFAQKSLNQWIFTRLIFLAYFSTVSMSLTFSGIGQTNYVFLLNQPKYNEMAIGSKTYICFRVRIVMEFQKKVPPVSQKHTFLKNHGFSIYFDALCILLFWHKRTDIVVLVKLFDLEFCSCSKDSTYIIIMT